MVSIHRRGAGRSLADDDVDDAAGDVDELLELLAAHPLVHLRHREDGRLDVGLLGRLARDELCAHLAVDLHGQRHLVLHAECLVVLGPRRVGERALAAEHLPDLLAQVRRERREQQGERAHRLGGQCLSRVERLQVVGIDHELRDRRVESHVVHVGRHLLDGLVHDLLRGLVHGHALRRLAALRRGLAQAEGAPLEAHDARDLLRLPRLDCLERSHEHLVEAHRVGAVLLDDVVGVDDVASALGHLLAVGAEDHALVHQLLEGLGVLDQVEVEEHLVPEARVEQVQHGVLGAAHVEVDRQPRLIGLGAPTRLRVGRVGEAQVVPARARPLGHGVGLARPPRAVLLLEVAPVDAARQAALRVIARLEVGELGQLHRQLRLGHRLGQRVLDRVRRALARVAAGLVEGHREDDRDGLAPVALAREDPVAQLEGRHALALALALEARDHRRLALLRRQPVEPLARVDRDAVLRESRLQRLARRRRRLAALGRLHHHLDRQVVRRGELEVALVVRRHRHHGARAVTGEHIVRHPDRHRRARQRVRHLDAGEDARLGLGDRAVEVAHARGLAHVLAQRLLLRQLQRRELLDERVLGREHDVGRAHEGVGPRREDLDHVFGQRLGRGALSLGGRGDAEVDVRALRAADPVLLRGLRALWPVDPARLEVVGEAVGVRGDLQHPLAQRHPDDREAATLGETVDDLLVGEHGAELGAPVDELLVLEGEAALEELQEDPLGPLDVPHVGRRQLALPVVREAERLELPLEVCDVLLGRLFGVRPRVDGVLLGRKAEGVPAHGMQHVVVLHPPVPRHDVRSGVAFRVTHVQARARRVREHVKHVLLLLALAPARGEGVLRLPVLLPLGLHRRVVVL
mmetsp:Transcript_66760/g.161182  ORF Transcript_66760/g.161182 Transcript_66760/m.161182 type:complete len:863 (-) Transcript_66760:217-2805(-)